MDGVEMSLESAELISDIPDLRDIPLDQLVKLGDSVLGHSLARYRRRLAESGVPLVSFTARI
jgi:FXSXX-COOH protein